MRGRREFGSLVLLITRKYPFCAEKQIEEAKAKEGEVLTGLG